MKEEKARTLTCPFIQNGLLVGASIKPIDVKDMEHFADKTVSANINCITTGCMAWKKAYKSELDNTDGYCSLIGKANG